MSNGSAINWGANVPLYSPEGDLHVIPQEQVPAALADPGTKRAIPMVDPQGAHHWVHEDEVKDAVANGGRISFPSQDIPPWLGFTPGNVGSNIWQGAKGMVTGAASLAKDLISNPNWFEGGQSTYQKFVGMPAEEQVAAAGRALEAGHPTEAAGHALASAVPMVGPWAASLGEQAGRGDIGGAAGQAAGVYGTGKTVQYGPRMLNRVIPSTARAGAGIGEIKAAIGQTEPNATAPVQLANHIADSLATNRPGVKLPPAVEGFIAKSQMASNPQAVAEAGAAPQALDFNSLHESLDALNKEMYVDRSVPASMMPQTELLAQSIADTLARHAEEMGVGRDWARQTREYARAQSYIRTGKKYGPAVGGAAGALAGSMLGIPGLPGEVQAFAPLAGEAVGLGLGTRYGGSIAGTLVKGVMERGNAGEPALPQTRRLAQPPAPPVVNAPPAPPSSGGRRVTSEAVPVEQRMGGERRGSEAARAKFDAMTPDERYHAAYTKQVTGLPNERAFAESAPAPAYGMSDVAGLKWLNEEHGTAAGDALLQAKANALHQAGLEAYHTGGDEFIIRGQSPMEINNGLVKANEILRNSGLEFKDAKTGKIEHYTGAEFRHGVGPDLATAERGMLARKAADKVNVRGKQGTLRRVPSPPETGTE